MTWFQLKDKQFPQKGSWVIIRSSQKHVPKYEVCIYDGGEWFIPAYDDSCMEKDIIEWCYIEK